MKSQLGEALRKFLQATVVVNKEKKLVSICLVCLTLIYRAGS